MDRLGSHVLVSGTRTGDKDRGHGPGVVARRRQPVVDPPVTLEGPDEPVDVEVEDEGRPRRLAGVVVGVLGHVVGEGPTRREGPALAVLSHTPPDPEIPSTAGRGPPALFFPLWTGPSSGSGSHEGRLTDGVEAAGRRDKEGPTEEDRHGPPARGDGR